MSRGTALETPARLQELEAKAASLRARRAEMEQAHADATSARAQAVADGDLEGARDAAGRIRQAEQALADLAEDCALVAGWADEVRAVEARRVAGEQFRQEMAALATAEAAARHALGQVGPAFTAALDAAAVAVRAHDEAVDLHGRLVNSARFLGLPGPTTGRSPSTVAMQEAFTADPVVRDALVMARAHRHVKLP